MVMEKKAYLEVAKIINTHGVRGAVKLELWCDGPQTFKKIKRVFLANGTEYEVSDVKTVGAFVVCSLSGIATVEDAIKLKNKILLAKREDIPLPKGSHFICDLIGLPVKDAASGEILHEGDFVAPANASTRIASLPLFFSDKRMLIFEWNIGGEVGINHYQCGYPPFTLGEYTELLKKYRLGE